MTMRRLAVAVLVIVTSTVAPSFVTSLPVANADPAAGPGFVSQATTGALAAGTIPDGTCRARVRATGGSGGMAANPVAGGFGGGAATIDATLTVLPGQSYDGSVAGGGINIGSPATNGGPGGVGGGGRGGNASPHPGAGGGGRTVVNLAGSAAVVAGGGGGGGGAHTVGAGNGGAGGTTFAAITGGQAAPGSNGTNGIDTAPVIANGGQGGQVAGGGSGGNNTGTGGDGVAGTGTPTGVGGAGGDDNSADAGGGGAAGYTGGGGGAATQGSNTPITGGGGGGGSSFVVASPVVSAGTLPAPTGVAAAANTTLSTPGANGSLGIDWLPCEYNLNLTKTVAPSPVNAGDKATWTIAITNAGPDPMTRGDTIDLTDTLPAVLMRPLLGRHTGSCR